MITTNYVQRRPVRRIRPLDIAVAVGGAILVSAGLWSREITWLLA
jgi:hypothetical protein